MYTHVGTYMCMYMYMYIQIFVYLGGDSVAVVAISE